MMLRAGDFARRDCLKKKEDSIDLYNKCRGRQPLKKMAKNYIKPGPEGNIERGRQPHKKWLKAIRTILSQAQRAILREEDNLIKKWLKAIRSVLSH